MSNFNDCIGSFGKYFRNIHYHGELAWLFYDSKKGFLDDYYTEKYSPNEFKYFEEYDYKLFKESLTEEEIKEIEEKFNSKVKRVFSRFLMEIIDIDYDFLKLNDYCFKKNIDVDLFLKVLREYSGSKDFLQIQGKINQSIRKTNKALMDIDKMLSISFGNDNKTKITSNKEYFRGFDLDNLLELFTYYERYRFIYENYNAKTPDAMYKVIGNMIKIVENSHLYEYKRVNLNYDTNLKVLRANIPGRAESDKHESEIFKFYVDDVAYKLENYCKADRKDSYKKIKDTFEENKMLDKNKVSYTPIINIFASSLEQMGLPDRKSLEKIKEFDAKYNIKRFKDYKFSNGNFILKMYGIDTNNLWNNPEEKEKVLSYLYSTYSYMKSSILNNPEDFSIDPDLIIAAAKEYSIKRLKKDFQSFYNDYVRDKELCENIREEGNMELEKDSLPIFLKKLFKDMNSGNRIDIDESNELGQLYTKNTSTALYDYLKDIHQLEKYDCLNDKLNTLKKLYRAKHLLQIKKAKMDEYNEKYNMNKPIIEDYLDGDYKNIASYLEENNISKGLFDKLLKYAKEHDTALYEKYINKSKNNVKESYSRNMSHVLKIIEKITSKENNTIRKYDIIDYYLDTKMSFEELRRFTKGKLDNEQFKALRIFENNNKNANLNNYDINEILDTKVYLNSQLDKNNIPIPGTGEEFSNDKKLEIINFIKSHHIPLNRKTYAVAFKRYCAGTLFEENENVQEFIPSKKNR